MKLCRRCGNPVKVYENDYDIFEGMHWICFHLEFEHGDYDPDEACDDPSCLWNRINHKSEYIIEHEKSFVFKKTRQFIGFICLEQIKDIYPSVRFKISVEAFENFIQYDGIWFDKENITQFIEDALKLERQREGSALIKSMSPDEFTMKIEANKRGILVLDYELQKFNLNLHKAAIIGEMEIYPEELLKLCKYFKEVVSII
ncbi:hypothetical protein [Paenibacillus harenae]|uniref:hypothetical protein n=1 Tax=Paenibacillus harenae TaxID=306543 RepID=UPI00278D5EE9|nr:hypothetical protein [Paenibacillus harenae]MDQ0059997.1 hypothetical protein [Paenibacillus harenae]